MIGILILVVVLILHLSLYPWRFEGLSDDASPLTLFLHAWPRRVTRRTLYDVTANIAFYVPLGIAAYLALAARCRRLYAAAAAIALGTALSVAIEITQLYTISRICNQLDTIANALGTASGVALGALLKGHTARLPRLRRLIPIGGAGAALLLCCWVLYQTYPVMPETHRYIVLRKLRHLFSSGSFSLSALYVSAAEWIAVGFLVRSLWSARRAALVFTLLVLLVPARLLILEQTISWAELAALPLAFVGLGILPAGDSRRAFAAAIALCAALAVYGLAPFRLAPAPAAFEWIPFEALVGSDPEMILPVLLRKIFRYGALLWLLRASAFKYPAAATIAAAFVALIEAAQIYVAGHVAEVTDPLLVVMLALVLAAFERLNRELNAGPAGPPLFEQ